MNIVLHGYGRMSKVIEDILENTPHNIVEIVDFDRVKSMDEVSEEFDVIIDFSNYNRIDSLLDYLDENPSRCVIATTNLTEEQLNKIDDISKKCPIFQSYNTSYGVFVMTRLLNEASKFLNEEFSVGLLDTHHKYKQDSPSGTAKLLSEFIDRDDLQIQDFRLGNIVGEHKVSYVSEHEEITITHNAINRDLFASGAIKAAEILMTKENNRYDLISLFEKE